MEISSSEILSSLLSGEREKINNENSKIYNVLGTYKCYGRNEISSRR
jgi:hypothetical protein